MSYSIESFVRTEGEFRSILDPNCQVEDEDYIDGAIVWVSSGQCIISKDQWDLVDQLWAYLIRGASQLQSKPTFSCFFPDQPLRLEFTILDNGKINIVVGGQSVNIDRDEFYSAIISGGAEFFRAMIAMVPSKRCAWEIQLAELKRIATTNGIA